jgi:hypothetical protein
MGETTMSIAENIAKAVQVVKDNPLKTLAGLAGTVVLTVAGIMFSDARYVHEADDTAYRTKVAATLKLMTDTIIVMEAQIQALSKDK